MEAANANKGQDNEYGRNRENYTDLRWFYVIKGVIFLGIALLTLALSKEFEDLLLNASIFLIGICLDFFVSAHSNTGPVVQFKRIFSGVAFISLLVMIIVMIVVIIAIDEMRPIIETYNVEGIMNFIRICMICAGILGPFIEFLSNIPKDD